MSEAVIHTNSTYAPDLNVNITNDKGEIDALFDQAFNHLKEQELAFYHQFFSDVNDIDTFIQRIRDLLNKSENDMKCLKSFSNIQLSKYLPDRTPAYFEQGHRIILKGDAAKIDCNYTGENFKMSGIIYIDVVPENAQRIKHLLNVGLGRTNKVTAFDENTNKITSNLVDMLRKQRFGDLFTIQEATSPQSNPLLTEFDIRTVSKAKYNKENIEQLLKDPSRKEEASKLRMEARKSLYAMRDFIFSKMSGTTPAFQEAVKETWKEIFPSVSDDILLRNFFFEGENYIKSLLGQGGEFFNDVIIRYLNKVVPNDNPILVQIIGSSIKGGQQPHSDLQIMLACGANINFQTKNIDSQRRIETNTNAELIAKNFGNGVIVPLVNYYANASYSSTHGDIIPEIEELLSNRFFEAMNLNIREGLDNLQTNTFYFVGGNNIIPGSEIIQHLRVSNPTFSITGGNVNSYTDFGYAAGDPPTFIELKYWKYPKGQNHGKMIPWVKNEYDFNAAARSISISTSFSVSALINTGRFEIFNAY